MKKLKMKILYIIVILIMLISIILIASKTDYLKNVLKIGIKQKNEEIAPLFSYVVYDNKDTQKIKVLITVNSENGIEYIEESNGNKISSNGKNKVLIDYIVEKDVEQTFKIKEKNKEENQEKVLVTDDVISNTVKIEKVKENPGYKTIDISSNIDIDGYKTYYQIGKNGEWQEGTGKISILDYDITSNNLINEDNTVTISIKSMNENTSNVVTSSKDFTVDTTATLASFEADSLLEAMEKYDFGTGIFKVTVSDETYNLKVYSFDENVEIQSDTTFGTEKDVATANDYAQNMVVLKVNGDLTINEDVTLTAYASKDGYGGPKGMMIYCTGILTNNGTISMTARGAKAEGQNVYLWKNVDGTYEYVPSVGAEGGTRVGGHEVDLNGNGGQDGTNRQTGGGGSGSCYTGLGGTAYSGAGSKGTSYSGGTGGGAWMGYNSGAAGDGEQFRWTWWI